MVHQEICNNVLHSVFSLDTTVHAATRSCKILPKGQITQKTFVQLFAQRCDAYHQPRVVCSGCRKLVASTFRKIKIFCVYRGEHSQLVTHPCCATRCKKILPVLLRRNNEITPGIHIFYHLGRNTPLSILGYIHRYVRVKRSSALPILKILLRYPPVTMRHIWQLGWVNTSTGYIPFDLNEDRRTQCTWHRF